MMYASIHTSQTYAILTALGTLRPACHLIHSKVKETIPIHSISNSIKAAQSLCKYCHLIHSKVKETVALSIQIQSKHLKVYADTVISFIQKSKDSKKLSPYPFKLIKIQSQSLCRYCHLIHSKVKETVALSIQIQSKHLRV